MDVFEDEPPSDAEGLFAHPLSIFGSHNGSNTDDAVLLTSVKSIKLLRSLLDEGLYNMQRTVIVTGSSGGIGTKICEAFKAENWTVIGIDKSNAFKTHCDHHHLRFGGSWDEKR